MIICVPSPTTQEVIAMRANMKLRYSGNDQGSSEDVEKKLRDENKLNFLNVTCQ